MKTDFYGKKSGLLTAAIIAMTCILICSSSSADARQDLWQSRDQFVALEPQERASDAPPVPNSHPADLSLESLSAQLASITVRPADTGKATPLFTSPAVQTIAPHLQQALHLAAPNQDVTFAVIGLHDSLYGFAKSPHVTTGRIFYQGGRLNLIVGLMQQEVNEREDRRLHPFTPGSRQQATAGEWALLPQPGQDAFSLVRKDWAAFDDGWRSPVTPAPVAERQATPAVDPSVQPGKFKSDPRLPAERLTTLKELRDKGLISAEEYRVKRLEILDGL